MHHIAAVNSCHGVKCSTPVDLSVTTMTSAVNGHQFKRTWWGGDSRVSPTRTNFVHNCHHIAFIDMNFSLCNTRRIVFLPAGKKLFKFYFFFSKSSGTSRIALLLFLTVATSFCAFSTLILVSINLSWQESWLFYCKFHHSVVSIVTVRALRESKPAILYSWRMCCRHEFYNDIWANNAGFN